MANPEVAYEHSGSASPTTLAGDISDTAGSFSVVSGTGFPTGTGGSFFITIGRGTTEEERILCSDRVGNVLTVETGGRGVDGTVARNHSINATVEHTWTAIEATQLSTHVSSVQNVHGVSSAIVSVDDAQTLTNKTLTGPVLSAPIIADFTGSQHTHANAAQGANIPKSSVNGLVADLNSRELAANKGVANGYASLGAGVKVPIAQLPTGTDGSSVAIGNHPHAANIDLVRAALISTAVLVSNGSAGPKTVHSTALDVVAGEEYLVIGTVGGYQSLVDGEFVRIKYDLDVNTGGTLTAVGIKRSTSSGAIAQGANILGKLVASSTANINIRIRVTWLQGAGTASTEDAQILYFKTKG